MTQDLSNWVLSHLIEHSVDDDTADLVLAAMDGDSALDEALRGPVQHRSVGDVSEATPGPVGAFVKFISVQGFRGVGPKTRVDFHPAPGLTIVAGRNGSGKSSLAEALGEVALTMKTHRWHNTQFAQVWRNLHQVHPTEIQVELAQEDVGKSTIRVSWPQGESSNQAAHITYQRGGQKQEAGLGSLGWAEPLGMYRPILSYEDLGQLLMGRPIDLHKALAKVLGLEEIKSGIDLLTERRNALRIPLAQAIKDRRELRKSLASIDDERAAAADQLPKTTQPDLAPLRTLAVGETGTTTVGRTLADIAATSVPAADQVAAAAAALRNAASHLAELGERGQGLDDLRRALLEEALKYHSAAGPGPCPVCEQGSLDQDWKARTEQTVVQSTLLSTQRGEAESSLKAARSRALSLIATPPRVLQQTDLELVSQGNAVAPGSCGPVRHATIMSLLTTWPRLMAALFRLSLPGSPRPPRQRLPAVMRGRP